MSDKLHNDEALAERSALQAEAIMELLEVCVRWMISSSNRKMTWLWGVLNHPT
jgi:hypothetical protein